MNTTRHYGNSGNRDCLSSSRPGFDSLWGHMDNTEDFETWDALAAVKGRRSWRRECAAKREAGSLRKWFSAQDVSPWQWWDSVVRDRETLNQMRRATRHRRCHCQMCTMEKAIEKRDNRSARYASRRELRALRRTTWFAVSFTPINGTCVLFNLE